ncbi:serine proteinase [Cubamyces sp. BRFM 1775]|nr:serine proteinase [Cubamyces sp. BRFM 1775]
MSSGAAPMALVEIQRVDGDKKENSYIVHLKDGTDKARYLRTLRGQLGANSTITHDYPSRFDNAFAGIFDEPTLEVLRASPEVESITEDAIGTLFTTFVQNDATWALNRLSQKSKLTYKYTYDLNAAGKGVDIFIIDSGVNVEHVEFGGRAKWGWVAPDLPQEDETGHGTQVAGVAAGTRYGVAKEASIIAVKTHNADGRAPVSVAKAGMAWVHETADPTKRPAVVNISFGYFQPTPDIDDGVAKLTSKGIHVCVAAGNKSCDAADVSPARAPSAITVGACNGDDMRHKTSNYGEVLTLFAPGACIKTATNGSTTAETVASGTSVASPHVAGLVAYSISLKGNVSPAEMKVRLKGDAVPGTLSDIPDGTPNLLANNGN